MFLTKDEIKIALCCLCGVIIFFSVSLSVVFGINAAAGDEKTPVESVPYSQEASEANSTNLSQTNGAEIEYKAAEIKTPLKTASVEEKKEDAAAKKKKQGEVIKTDSSKTNTAENADKATVGASSYKQGWNIIGKEKYYMGENGFYTGMKNIGGLKYRFDNSGKLTSYTCIDVSEHQGETDWKAVKASGVDFAFIRCAWRGNSKGGIFLDSAFEANIKKATEAGIACGVYIFSQATDEREGVEEASYVLNIIKPYKISLPVVIDVELSGGRGDKIDVAARTKAVKAFCETVKNAGYYPMIYSNRDFLRNNLIMSQLKYDVWAAQYAQSCDYSGYKIWQYTQRGSVKGINGEVDLNICLMNYPEYLKNKGLNNL